MELFDKKFVHFMWDDELMGKDCFIADNIDGLKSQVNDYFNDNTTRVINSGNTDFPFHEPDGVKWRFCYYDPNYFVKKAFAEGKQIQAKSKYHPMPWVDCEEQFVFDDNYEYRIKPKEPRRMTNRELARWLAQGKGQWKGVSSHTATTSYSYGYGLDNREVLDNIMIRGWDEVEWREPVIEEADE